MNTLAKHELKEIQPGVTVALHHCSSELVGVAGYNGSRRLVAFQAIAAGTMIFRIEGRETRRPTRFSIQIAEDRHVDSAIEELMRRYAHVLRDSFYTEREGRWVLPVRNDAHERFPGIVHA